MSINTSQNPQSTNLNTALLGLSSNLGNRLLNLQQAKEQIAQAHSITAESQIYQTSPWGLPDQPDFYNQCIQIQTSASPIALLDHLQQIENNLKRVRTIKYGPRTLDLDILFYNQETISSPRLQVPHPLIQDRNFVLIPLQEIAPNFTHPTYKKTITELSQLCQDQGDCIPV